MPKVDHLRALPVSKLIMISTILVALLPISILGFHVYQSAWENSWREIREKHQLIAQNLAVPLGTYVEDHRVMLSVVAETINLLDQHDQTTIRNIIQRTLQKSHGFKSLLLLDMQGHIIAYADPGMPFSDAELAIFAKEKCYLKVRNSKKWAVSKIKHHPVTGKPTLFMGVPHFNQQQEMIGVLLGELRIDLIESIRAQVKFGKKGHSAIIDHSGHVIAHPNPAWMAEIRDLSDWPIVKAMMAGKTGVTSFYSPFMKGNMVAGYAAVPNTGWGIMVPQPESEVAEHVNSLMLSHLTWASVGLLLAILVAITLSRWVTHPLNRLATMGKELLGNGLNGDFLKYQRNTNGPAEVRQLCTVVRTLISGLQSSRDEVQKLNNDLQQRVDAATAQLREANHRLEEAAQHDYLTNLANRRYFENSLQQALSRRSGDIDHVCVLLIDIDHFKQINDSYGHAAGDAVLNQVARILERTMRSGDLVARYGGDEFVAYMRCAPAIGHTRAAEIHEAIHSCTVRWQKKIINITASIGLHCQQLYPGLDVNKIMLTADNAMYKAKQRGRNQVAEANH